MPSGDPIVVHWTGGSGNWSDPTHWDIRVVPNNSGPTSYQVVIDDLLGTVTITVDQTLTINSLTNAETIFVAAGADTITQQTTNSGTIQVTGTTAQLNLSGTINDNGQILATTGTLNLSNATLTVTGSGAQVTASGLAATLSNVNLYASSGGQILFPAATSYADGVRANYTIQATDVGSKIDLSHLASMAGSNSYYLKIGDFGHVGHVIFTRLWPTCRNDDHHPSSGSRAFRTHGGTAFGVSSPWLCWFLLDLAASEDNPGPNREIQVVILTSVDAGLWRTAGFLP